MEKHIVVPNEKNLAYAEVISKWINISGSMLKKTPGDVLGLFAQGLSVLVMDGVEYPLSHAAVSGIWPDDWIELGAVVTEETHRKMGLAHLAVKALLVVSREKYPDHKMFALCNRYSLPLFLDCGGVIMPAEDLPEQVWEDCIKCPMRIKAQSEGKKCCDTPVNMTLAGVR